MIGTLITLIILGVMAVVMFNTLSGSPSSTTTTSSIPGGTTTTAPVSPESGAQEAAVSACQANFQAIETAIADYQSLNGSPPAAGTAWVNSSAHGGPYLQSWPATSRYYTLTWTGAQLDVTTPTGVASHGTYGTASPKTGCFAA